MKISSKILKAGDEVYSAANGQPMKVTRVMSTGFYTEEEYYSFDEHRLLFWLTERGYRDSKTKKAAEKRALLNSTHQVVPDREQGQYNRKDRKSQ